MKPTNSQKGQKGFQSKLSQKQQLELLEVWIQTDWATRPANKWLKEKYDIELKQNTMWYYKQRLKKRWAEASSDLDNPADWGDFLALTKHNVPPEHRRELHKVWMRIENDYRLVGRVAVQPTYRRLHWWAYVIQYYGDVIEDQGDRLWVAEGYALRHMAADLFGLPMETNDLDQWLHYQPWKGGDREATYLKLIDEGLIPPIKESLDSIDQVISSDTPIVHAKTIERALFVQIGALKPYLLRSQIIEDLMKLARRPKVETVLESYRGKDGT